MRFWLRVLVGLHFAAAVSAVYIFEDTLAALYFMLGAILLELVSINDRLGKVSE